ncbi:MAG: protein kinase [Oscillospiraceae bacterium]|nr:protein kinase [Oscillospiraceae bacterium]
MIEINGKKLCENCFEEISGEKCSCCGFDPSDGVLDQSLLASGSILSDRYVIGQVIGKGGFGTTYLAYDALVCKKIAIKEYFPYGIAQRTFESADVSVLSEDNAQAFKLGAEKFYNEAKLVSRFNGNPNIVGVYDCFYENNTVYMAMEYLSGCTLKEYIREHGVLSVPQALYVAKSVVGALVVAHSASILHRDISPDNIIIGNDGNIKLIDFGAARQVVAEHSQSFSVILKPGFAPPEQYSKKGNQSAWTDVYSVGTTLYYMITGDIPEDPSARFDNDDTFNENKFDIAPALWEVITKATKLKVEDRYQDAYELKKALDLIPTDTEPLVIPEDAEQENEEAAPKQDSRSELTVSIKKPKPKQSFWKKHRRTFIEAVCGLLVVALVVPLAIKAYTPVVTGNPQSGTSDNSSLPTVIGSVAAIGNKPTLEDINHSSPLYDGLDTAERQLYSDIYYGLIKDEKEIVLDTLTYTIDDIDYVYSCVLNEEPVLVHTRGYNVNYNDLNNNKQPDPDEYVNSIAPIYSGIDRVEYQNFILEYIKNNLRAKDIDNNTDADTLLYKDVEALKYCFNDIAVNTTVLGGYNTRPSASTAYGAMVDHYADKLGIARALCDVAQRMGFDSYVHEGYEADGDKIAYCRVKIDDVWYMVDVYLASYFVQNGITAVPFAEDEVSHFYFLMADAPSLEDISLIDERQRHLWDTGDKVYNNEYDTLYYFKEHLKVPYYSESYEETYAALLEETKKQADLNSNKVDIYILAPYVDTIWAIMEEQYISDLSEKYGITITDFTGEYADDCLHITLT